MSKKRRAKAQVTDRTVKLTVAEAAELLRTVRDDIEFLRSLNLARPSRTAVRVASSILRRLLGDGMLDAAWQVAGFDRPLMITATDLQHMVENVPARYIHYAYAGGARTQGASHTGYMLAVIPRAEVEAEGVEAVMNRSQRAFRPGLRRPFTLMEFCMSPSVISGYSAISRLGVIRYVANKLGGVHWDNTRKAWNDPVGARHRLLDEGHLIVGRLPGPLYEILSVAEAVVTSNDILELSTRIDKEVPEDERADDVLSFREGRAGRYSNMVFSTPGQTGHMLDEEWRQFLDA